MLWNERGPSLYGASGGNGVIAFDYYEYMNVIFAGRKQKYNLHK